MYRYTALLGMCTGLQIYLENVQVYSSTYNVYRSTDLLRMCTGIHLYFECVQVHRST